MELQFFGAVRTVTGSQHMLRVNGQQILLDCGLFQGKRQEMRERNLTLPYDPRSLTCVVLSHAHIDHSGNLPQLVKQQYNNPVYCTVPTKDLCYYMLRDAANIQERDIEWLNKRMRKKSGRHGNVNGNGHHHGNGIGKKDYRRNGKHRHRHHEAGHGSGKHAPVLEPLYRMEDAERVLTLFKGVPYEKTISIAKGVKATFYDAGHILGSASVLLELQERGRTVRLGFSGDIGRDDLPILRDPVPLKNLDALIIESTYGDKLHEPVDDLQEHFAQIIKRTADRGGRVIIPAFSVGRTQRVVYFLHKLYRAGRLPRIPVFVDSPLSSNATKVFRAHPDCFDEEARNILEEHGDLFGFDLLRYVESVEESKALNEHKNPIIVISASGMCESGRILHHLRNSVGDPRNTVIIVGYMAEHTLGRRLVEKRPVVRIYGEEHQVKCEIVTLNGFSGHADRNGLLEWMRRGGTRPERTFVVHGDEKRSLAFKHTLEDEGYANVAVPEVGERFTI